MMLVVPTNVRAGNRNRGCVGAGRMTMQGQAPLIVRDSRRSLTTAVGTTQNSVLQLSAYGLSELIYPSVFLAAVPR